MVAPTVAAAPLKPRVDPAVASGVPISRPSVAFKRSATGAVGETPSLSATAFERTMVVANPPYPLAMITTFWPRALAEMRVPEPTMAASADLEISAASAVFAESMGTILADRPCLSNRPSSFATRGAAGPRLDELSAMVTSRGLCWADAAPSVATTAAPARQSPLNKT